MNEVNSSSGQPKIKFWDTTLGTITKITALITAITGLIVVIKPLLNGPSKSKISFYKDADKDGYGDPNSSIQSELATVEGYVNNNSDCCDNDKKVWDMSTAQTWFEDADGDGYGNRHKKITSNVKPDNVTENSEDFDDTDNRVFPHQEGYFTELSNGGIFDYDCSRTVEKQFEQKGYARKNPAWELKPGAPLYIYKEGWKYSVPPPGGSDTYIIGVDSHGNAITEIRKQGAH